MVERLGKFIVNKIKWERKYHLGKLRGPGKDVSKKNLVLLS